jgi:hypothetical protein
MKWLMMVVTGLMISLNAYSSDNEISGQIIDQKDHSPIIGAHIIVKNSSPMIGAISDLEGNFSLNFSGHENDTLLVTYIGYKNHQLVVKSIQNQSPVTIFLEQDMLEEILILASKDYQPVNEFAEVSSRFISMEEADKLPGGFNDIGRMAQNFSGVQKNNDASNEIIVRGNNPGSVLWRIEGIDVPNPNHFAEFGTSGGPLSLLNTNTIRDSDFYTGAFPAEYGNATGAAFDIRLRNGNKDKIKYMGQLGFNGMELMADGPLKRGSDATFLINYRNSNLTLLEKMNLIDFDIHLGVPTFNDLAFKLNMPTNKYGQFSFFGITGKSDVSTEASRIIKKENTSEEARQKAKDEAKDEHYGSLTGIYGLNHAYNFGGRTSVESSLSYTRSRSYFDLDTLDHNYQPHPNYEHDFTENRFAIRSKVNHRINDQNLISAGVTYTHFLYGYQQKTFISNTHPGNQQMEENGSAGLFQSFFQYKLQLNNNKIRISPGLHYQYFAYNNTDAIEPRLSMGYHLTDSHELTVGLGKHSQLLPVNAYFQHSSLQEHPESPNEALDFQRSLHYVLGHKWQMNEKFKLNTELYYQHLYSVPVDYQQESSWSMINGINRDFNGNQPVFLSGDGQGKNYGVDLSLEYSDDNGWHSMINTSLFQSKYSGSDGIWRNTTWNGNYIFNAIIGKHIRIGEHKLSFNLKTNWTGGRRYTPIDLKASQEAGQTVRYYDRAFSERYPDYFKMDFKIGYFMPFSRTSHEFVLDFQNITNRQNVFYEKYSPSSGQIKTIYQLDFFPVFQYRIFF